DAKKGVIKEANETFYDQKITFEMMRDELETITSEQADELISEAERQRDETIKKANEMHERVLSKAEEYNPKIFDEVSKTTGEILTEWDVLKKDIALKNYNVFTDTQKTWKNIKEVFTGNKIKVPKPDVSAWGGLMDNARSTWGQVKSIFQQKISMPSPTM